MRRTVTSVVVKISSRLRPQKTLFPINQLEGHTRVKVAPSLWHLGLDTVGQLPGNQEKASNYHILISVIPQRSPVHLQCVCIDVQQTLH